MVDLKAFVAGFVATLLFHQGLLALLHARGVSPRKAFDLSPTKPLGVPLVVSLAFWGGLWGILLWRLVARAGSPPRQWLLGLVLGAILPSLVALFVVMPLKGMK